MFRKALDWWLWALWAGLLLYDKLVVWLGRLAVPWDFDDYIGRPLRENAWPLVQPMLTWEAARWFLFLIVTVALVWTHCGNRIRGALGWGRHKPEIAPLLAPQPQPIHPVVAVDMAIKELREKIRRLMLLLAGGDPNNELPNEINKIYHFIKVSDHPVWRDLQLEQWRADLLLLVPIAKNLRGSSLGLYSSIGERDDMLGRLRESAEKIDAKLASYGAAPVENVSMPPSPGQAPPAPAPSHFPAGLYVGQMHMDLSRLADERHMSVSFSLFNGTGEPIFLSGIGGSITYSEVKEGSATRIGELPPPMLENTQGQRMEAQPFKEYLVAIYQRVPADTADRIRRLLEGGGEAHFDFDKLTVSAALCANPADTGRIRLWDGASLSKRPDSYACGRIIDSSAEIRANLGMSA